MQEALLILIVRRGGRLLYNALLALRVVGRGRLIRVVRLPMTATVDFSLKRSATYIAGERLVARVFSRVSNQVRRLTERLATHCTLVGLLS